MLLLIIAVALFVPYKVAQYVNHKYDGMDDFSVLSRFYRHYWRTSQAIEGACLTASMTCVWFHLHHIEVLVHVVQVIAAILLCVLAFSVVCALFVGIYKTLEFIFGSWEDVLYDARDKWDELKRGYAEWRHDLRVETADIVVSYALNAGSLLACLGILWTMAATVIPSIPRIRPL